jgi:HEPN domain-containing protein
MTPNEWLLDETRRWVQRAQDDLRAAEVLSAELPATALFLRQQAAERYLKAYLT